MRFLIRQTRVRFPDYFPANDFLVFAPIRGELLGFRGFSYRNRFRFDCQIETPISRLLRRTRSPDRKRSHTFRLVFQCADSTRIFSTPPSLLPNSPKLRVKSEGITRGGPCSKNKTGFILFLIFESIQNSGKALNRFTIVFVD